MVFTLNIWFYYLYGIHVDILTDQNILLYVLTKKELNLKQRRVLELLKLYDINIIYHPCKANVIVDTLSRLSMVRTANVDQQKRKLGKYVHILACL